MGHNDFYPFVIPAPAYDKLAFVHEVIRQGSRMASKGLAHVNGHAG
jgi:hypothetical protein